MEFGAIFLALAVAGLVGGLVKFGMNQQELWRKALLHSANQLGLRFDPGSFWRKAYVEGVVDGLPIKLDSYTVSTGKSSTTYTRIVVVAQVGELRLSREGVGSAFTKAFVGQDVQIGIRSFDDAIVVRGRDEAEVLAALGADARAAAMTAIGGYGVKVAGNELTFTRSGLIRDQNELLAIARATLDLGRALQSQATLPNRLAAHAETDPDARYRRRCLSALLSSPRLYSTEAGRRAARRALEDGDAAVRIMAGEALGPEGLDVLLREARVATVPAPLLARAASALGRFGADRAEVVTAALEGLLGPFDTSVVAAALEGLEALGRPAPVSALLPLVAADKPHTAAAARALGRHPDPRAKAKLVELLDGDRASDTRTAAARALAQHGTIEVVEPLMACTKGLFTDGDLKSAAREAIERIQSRLGDVGAGRLSVLEVEGGQLSEAGEAGEGGLSEHE